MTSKPTEQDWLDGVAEIVFDYCVNTPESKHPEVFGNTEAATTQIIQLIRTKLEAEMPKPMVELHGLSPDIGHYHLGRNNGISHCKATINKVLREAKDGS